MVWCTWLHLFTPCHQRICAGNPFCYMHRAWCFVSTEFCLQLPMLLLFEVLLVANLEGKNVCGSREPSPGMLCVSEMICFALSFCLLRNGVPSSGLRMCKKYQTSSGSGCRRHSDLLVDSFPPFPSSWPVTADCLFMRAVPRNTSRGSNNNMFWLQTLEWLIMLSKLLI